MMERERPHQREEEPERVKTHDEGDVFRGRRRLPHRFAQFRGEKPIPR